MYFNINNAVFRIHENKSTRRHYLSKLFYLPYIIFYYLIFCIIASIGSCKKVVEIDQPVSSITTQGAFSSDVTATSAVTGIYSNLINTSGGVKFGSGAISIFVGLSSDELTRIGIDGDLLQLQSNNLLPDNATFPNSLWGAAYFTIFQSTACLEGLQKSKELRSTIKNQLAGECKFLRAYCYFYLANLWGDIPTPLTSDWNRTYLLPRTPKAEVYQQIIADLQDAQDLLANDYAISGNERIRANKYAATALLARVYLYLKDWVNAEMQASSVINNSVTFKLVSDLNKVFLKNSSEAILQFQPSNTASPYAVVEQNVLSQNPYYYLTNNILNAFDSTDKRKTAWINSTVISGSTYYYPYKYKVRQGTAGGIISEYYMVLRLAEQYLIRAEARTQQNKISEAQSDLNMIRSRANLSLTTANDKPTLLLAIEHERQVELVAEWGHRWFDLIRTDRANSILGPIKGSNWQSTDQLYPIPQSEIQRNPNLTQNSGY